MLGLMTFTENRTEMTQLGPMFIYTHTNLAEVDGGKINLKLAVSFIEMNFHLKIPAKCQD
jgi:hypothetical protein